MRISLPFLAFCLSAFCPQASFANDPAKHYEPSAQEFHKGYSAGWPEALLPLKKSLSARKSYVFWIVNPPETPLDLRSAEHFRKFLKRNSFFRGGISHNFVAWSCPGKISFEGITGMSGESYQQSRKMFEDGFGLSPFISTYTDGFLETKATAQKNLVEKTEEFGMVAVGFEIPHSQCEEMVNFLEDFTFHPNKPFLKFGFLSDPEKMEGGGCVNFASTLIQKAGVMKEIVPQFYRAFSVDKNLFSKPSNLPPFTSLPEYEFSSQRLPLPQLLDQPWLMGEVQLKIMDPELVLHSFKIIKNAYLSKLSVAQKESEKSNLEKTAFGDRWVLSSQFHSATKEWEPRNYRVDASFDSQAARVAKATSQFMMEKLKSGTTIRKLEVLGSPVLLLENFP